MPDFELDNSAVMRRIVRAVCDLARRPLTGLRVLDLGCAHGLYSLEMAKLGAQVVGIEGRASWLEIARRQQQASGLTNVEFFQDDARNLSKAKYGEFDIVLCLGLLYHLDAPDVFDFLAQVYDVCREFTVIETHVSLAPVVQHTWRGHDYWGNSILEHLPGTSADDKLKQPGASLDNEQSFWLTQASLCNILRHLGYTSVFDCRNPLAFLSVGPAWQTKIWGNRVTFAAIKGQPLELPVGPAPVLELDWPELLDDVLYERFLIERNSPVGIPAAAPRVTPGEMGSAALLTEVRRLQALVTRYERSPLLRVGNWLRRIGLRGR